MISQAMKNIASGCSKISDYTQVMDGSLKLRLRKMRVVKEDVVSSELTDEQESEELEDVDNCIAAAMHLIYNFRRLRHADKIGFTYWLLATDATHNLTPIDFFTMLDGKVHSIRRSNAVLSGDLEFPSNTWESDMNCLVTFVEGSSKSKIVGQYHTLHNKMVAADARFLADRAIESYAPPQAENIEKALEEEAITFFDSQCATSQQYVSYNQGEYEDALAACAEIEQQTEEPVARPKKGRLKAITQDKTEKITLSSGSKKSGRKSECRDQEPEVIIFDNDGDQPKKVKLVRCAARSSRQKKEQQMHTD